MFTRKVKFSKYFFGAAKSWLCKSGEKPTTRKNATFSNNSRTFLSCPDLPLRKGKSIPCRGFSRSIFASFALLWQRVLTAQMENVETFIRMLFQLHQAEACGISLWYIYHFPYSSNSLKKGRMYIKMHSPLSVITHLFESLFIGYSTWVVHVLWKYS